MGIYYSAVVIIGLPRCDIDYDKLISLLDEDKLSVCPPYYDGNSDDNAIVGLFYKESPDFAPLELAWDHEAINKLKDEFFSLTGQHGRVYISPQGF